MKIVGVFMNAKLKLRVNNKLCAQMSTLFGNARYDNYNK